MNSLKNVSGLIIISFILTGFSIKAQSIIWQKCLGGSNRDYAYSSQPAAEGGYILCGFSNSNNGNISGNHGGDDLWLQKLDEAGNLTWQKCLGGIGMDYGWAVEQLSDGNYIIAGYTNSNDGDVTGNHGYYDAWIVKVDTSGNIIWQKCFGGTGLDEALSVQQTTDEGFIVCGLSASTDGNLTGNQGGYDYWVIKLDGNGNLLWQKNFGGSGDDYGHKAVQTSDGGYIVTGMSGSNDGDVSGNHGNNDLWTVKLDSGGNIEWKKCLGGSEEEGATAIEQTTDGGFIIAGSSA